MYEIKKMIYVLFCISFFFAAAPILPDTIKKETNKHKCIYVCIHVMLGEVRRMNEDDGARGTKTRQFYSYHLVSFNKTKKKNKKQSPRNKQKKT